MYHISCIIIYHYIFLIVITMQNSNYYLEFFLKINKHDPKVGLKNEMMNTFLKANYNQGFLQITCCRALKIYLMNNFQSKVVVKKTLH